jgi:hypothetical protein
VTHWLLAATGTTERFTVILAFLTALLGLVGLVVRTAFKIGQAIARQIEALEANTSAVKALSGRVDALEGRS